MVGKTVCQKMETVGKIEIVRQKNEKVEKDEQVCQK